MRLINSAFRERLKTPVLTTCLCWQLARQDGFTLCLTDHDTSVAWNGDVFAPGASLDGGQFVSSDNLAPGRASAAGALSAESITIDALAAGDWNGARVSVFRVDWAAADHGVLIWTGYLSEVVRRGEAFEAELISLKADLERPVGRTYGRRCVAALGDARCGLSGVEGQACDKQFATCRDTFENTANFRGFPHMPGPDAVLSGPPATGNDGGKR